ncbi:flagellar motor protein MotB [Carnobacterium funditum]|uniref:flagellar motor protein MotB n=1 Tax=Carnobacterium funditum TaxID=2752 RepID=UPI000550AD11|nr:OmpA family protein [Carnobacterium funditum]
MARRKKAEQKAESSGGWIVTYSDLMSLLLTFFILLYSMSSVSQVKFMEASQSLQMALNGKSGGSTILNETTSIVKEPPASPTEEVINPEIKELYEKVTNYVEENDMTSKVSVEMDKDGVYVDIQESVLFDSGSADISEPGKNTLRILAELVNSLKNDIVVEGYTDDVPIKNANFSNNWELSSGRAISVLRYLSEKEEVDPHRLSAKGYGEYNPNVPNNTDENRAVNRRVNMVIVYDSQEAKR